MSKTYIALIADAIASRELPPAARARLQADARTAVKDLNQRYRRVLAARFAVTLGDELQCLLPTPQPVWDVAHDLRARLPSVDWVVACGRGLITTPLAPTAPEIDGPCFHDARAARQLLLRAVLELDPAPAAHRHPAAAGRPGGRRGPAGRRSQRDLLPRPAHGLAPRGRRG